MLVGIITPAYWKITQKVLWKFFLWGALAWIIGVALKSIPPILAPIVDQIIQEDLPRWFSGPIHWIYIGSLTGVFECGTTLFFAYIIKSIRTAGWNEAVGFGLSFGAIEALLVGLGSFIVVLLVILIPDKLPSKIVELAAAGSDSLWVIPAPIIERAIAVFAHAFSCVLIIYAVQAKAWRWFWVSFFYKTAIDGFAAYWHLTIGIENVTTAGLWITELIFLPSGIIGLWGLLVFRRRWRKLLQPTPYSSGCS